jgi:hypothetical protein
MLSGTVRRVKGEFSPSKSGGTRHSLLALAGERKKDLNRSPSIVHECSGIRGEEQKRGCGLRIDRVCLPAEENSRIRKPEKPQQDCAG